MDPETVILSEVSQTEKEKYHDIPYVWNLKGNDTNELTKQKETQIDSENEFMVAGVRAGRDC